ncbi:hypothetical protein GQ472_01630 [archaeon]|nr:hypothetical protein [archaeon]
MTTRFITKGKGAGRRVIPISASVSNTALARVYKEMDKTFKVGKEDASLYVHLNLRNGEDIVLDIPKEKVAKLLADMDTGKSKNVLIFDDDCAVRIADIVSIQVDDAEMSAISRPED